MMFGVAKVEQDGKGGPFEAKRVNRLNHMHSATNTQTSQQVGLFLERRRIAQSSGIARVQTILPSLRRSAKISSVAPTSQRRATFDSSRALSRTMRWSTNVFSAIHLITWDIPQATSQFGSTPSL
jgi:hypothetical protein